jgi:hypothetical protein
MVGAMQTGIEDPSGPVKQAPRRRRWLVIVLVLVAVLALYAGALAWVNQRLQTDIQKSIHVLPADNQDHSVGE